MVNACALPVFFIFKIRIIYIFQNIIPVFFILFRNNLECDRLAVADIALRNYTIFRNISKSSIINCILDLCNIIIVKSDLDAFKIIIGTRTIESPSV